MEKLLEFGRKAMFYVRVLSGYEERRIRSYRLQLQQRLQQAEARKKALKRIPEQIILSELRRMVGDMQSLNKKLDETEAAIKEYFNPIDKEAEIIMKMQLEGEERTMREMVKAMQKQALLEKADLDKIQNLHNADTQKQALLEKADLDKFENVHNADTNEHKLEQESNISHQAQMR